LNYYDHSCVERVIIAMCGVDNHNQQIANYQPEAVDEPTMKQSQQQQRHVSFQMSRPLSLDEVRIAAGQGDNRAAKALVDLDRLSDAKQQVAMLTMMHRLATAWGRGQYYDPSTGFMVFTSSFLKQQLQKCCGLGCRHCPYSRSCGSDGDEENEGKIKKEDIRSGNGPEDCRHISADW